MKHSLKIKTLAQALITVLIFLAASPVYAKSYVLVDEYEYDYDYKPRPTNGRNSFYISADTNLDTIDFSSFDFTALTVNNLIATLTWASGGIFFSGAEVDVNFNGLTNPDTKNIYGAGSLFGLAIPMGTLRLYGEGGAMFYSNQDGLLKAGGGLDVKLGAILLTFGYTYNWNYDLSSIISTYQTTGSIEGITAEDIPLHQYHSFFAGIGFTW